METWDALRARRNVRDYQDRPIPDDDLERILEAGRRTPSSQNLQRWDFVVCTERLQLKRLADVWRGASFVATSAATVALIAPQTNDPGVLRSIHYDLGQVTMVMMVAAADRGIGSGHTAVANQELARELLGHPDGMICGWLLALGYPADRPLKPIKNLNRRAYDEVVHLGGW